MGTVQARQALLVAIGIALYCQKMSMWIHVFCGRQPVIFILQQW